MVIVVTFASLAAIFLVGGYKLTFAKLTAAQANLDKKWSIRILAFRVAF